MKHLFGPAVAAVLALATPVSVQAAGAPVVVELFTSQGCSSCPPADQILADLSKRGDVIALALHVDYWDYMGWKDSFAEPAFTKRQRAYARAGHRKMIYTPQMIFNGVGHVEGSGAPKILEALDAARSAAAPAVALSRKGGTVSIRVAATPLDRPVSVELVRFAPSRTVRILRGENRGLTLTYSDVVTSWKTIGTWDGKQPLNLSAPARGGDAVAVLLQYPGPGAIVSAAQLR